jgi:pyruvate,orthophosphate dikinase
MISAESSKVGKKELAGKRVLLFADAYKYFDGIDTRMREELGGKGAGLAEMTAGGVNVPPGLTITTACCREYQNNGGKMPAGLLEEVFQGLTSVETSLGKKFGDLKAPLLLSVRSGAKFSMPGMMDTILNLGLNDETVSALVTITKNDRFAWDSYRRFLQMYGNVVLEISKDNFEDLLEDLKETLRVDSDADLKAEDLKKLVGQFKDVIKQRTGSSFPQGPKEQLKGAIEAVFRSWNNNRAVYYRNLHKIDHNLGTAVNVQAMVFGNLDDRSATGVCFTRDPSSGKKEIYGEYLTKAQGEDVVAGVRTPKNIKELEREMPAVFKELLENVGRLEKFYKDAQDIEFTVEQGRLFLLQTRTGKRTAQAAVKIAVDMVGEGLIAKEDALKRVEPAQLNQLLLPSFDLEEKKKAGAEGKLLAKGLNASPGAAIGKIVFDPSEAEKLAARNEKVILVRVETCPDDIHGIVPAQGVLTSRGGMTSHAAVVARGMGKPCVAGCEALNINLAKEEILVGSENLKKGDLISIDGSTGEVFKGALATRQSGLTREFKTLLEWADQVRRMRVRANADTPSDAKTARDFGAEGIGLCRTEHMFMAQDRLPAMQEMIMAETLDERKTALAKLLPMQCEDFKQIFRVMDGLPVTIRLLDPPLHEFLPKSDELIEEVATMRAKATSGSKLREKELLLKRVRDLKEANPMMGLRGCRLGLIYPEINKMQVEAIIEAAIAVKKEGINVIPEIMIPLVGEANELAAAKDQLEVVAKAAIERTKVAVEYKVGTMIEVPRACMVADEIAVHAEFFSFGTNDLTQMTFGFSRDDAEGKILQRYLEGIDVNGSKRKILNANPFEVLDRAGVGKLMKMAIEYGLQTRPDLKIGICGEHGGEPNSITFADQLGLDYVSCSPFRIPVARLAAARAQLEILEADK